jgi:hypothetical protein
VLRGEIGTQCKVEICKFGICVWLICHITTKLSVYGVGCEGSSSDEANVRPFIRNSVLPWRLEGGGRSHHQEMGWFHSRVVAEVKRESK